MQQYKDLLRQILTLGRRRGDRTGTGTISIFGTQLRFDLQDGFPLVTLKRTPIRPMVAELVWFLEGSTDNNRLRQLSGVKEGVRGIWDQWAVSENQVRLTVEERTQQWCARFKGQFDLIAKAHAFDHAMTYDDAVLAILARDNIPEFAPSSKLGSLGPIYGQQWRYWGFIIEQDWDHYTVFVDQIQVLIDGLKKNPYSRRHIVSAWKVEDLPNESVSPQENVMNGKMSLAPCHPFWQCYVRDMTLDERLDYYNENKASAGMKLGKPDDIDEEGTMEMLTKMGVPARFLDLHLYQRSWDLPVGAPFNIASYALLTHLLARECGYIPGELVISTGDAHIYSNQLEEVETMLNRDCRPLPTFHLDAWVNLKDIMDPTIQDKSEIIDRLVNGFENYNPHPAIKIAVAT